MDITDDQLERYSRHILLREIGGPGQVKLMNASVLVIGAGGLGSPVLMYLAAAGIGRIGVIDPDTVSLSNLQRQILHDTDSVGMAKTDSAKMSLHRINPDVEVALYPTRITPDNANDLIGQYDLVADGCDNFETRFIVNEACFQTGTPLVSGAVGRFDGQLGTFAATKDNDLPCYRCLVPEAPPAGSVQTCAEAGVIGALTGVIGSMQAMEVIKEITGIGTSMAGRLMLYDGLSTSSRIIKLKRDPKCKTCGTRE